MEFSKLFEKSDGIEFTTFPKSLDAYEGYKPVLIFIIGLVITMAVSAGIAGIFGKGSGNQIYRLIITSLTVIVMIPAIYIGTRLMYKIPFSTQIAPIRKWNWSIYFKTLIISLIVYGIFFGSEMIITGSTIKNNLSIITLLLCLILPLFQGFAEEYLCRGFLMQSFGSWIKIPIIAIILQATIFAVMHGYNNVASIGLVCTGLGYGFITWYGQGMEAPSAMHAVNNILAFLSIGLGLQESVAGDGVVELIANIILLVIPIGIVILLDKKYNWFDSKDVN